MNDSNYSIEHWNDVYKNKTDDKLSWFQSFPTESIRMVKELNLPLSADIIDIGGGDSRLADALLDLGYTNITVLDISETAIKKAKERLGSRSALIKWIVTDTTSFEPLEEYDLWHDRAAFHFLTADDKIEKYKTIAEKSIKQNGYLIIGTFSDKGPTKCSGLSIKQYTEAALASTFNQYFDKVNCFLTDHITPFNTIQNFIFCVFKK